MLALLRLRALCLVCCAPPRLWCAVRRRAAFCSVLWDKVCWRFVPAALVYPHAGSVKAGTFQNGRASLPHPPSRRLFDRCFRWLRVGLRTDWAAGL